MTSSSLSEPGGRIGPVAILIAVVTPCYALALGNWSIGASEAYSALAASQTHLYAVVDRTLQFDPGKPPLYQILLHWFTMLLGQGEVSLRAFSVIFALLTLLLLNLAGRRMVGPRAALAASILWAANPVNLILAQWARMYSMFICASVASLLTFWLLRQHSGKLRLGAFVLCETVALYTHLCSLLFAGALAAILVRDFHRGRRALMPWVGIALALLLFAPFVPTALAQTRALLFTHLLDWIGPAHTTSMWTKAATVIAVMSIVVALVLGPAFERDELEPMRSCLLWVVLPLIAFCAASILLHPVFSIRYCAPAIPVLFLLVGKGLETLVPRTRNLSLAGIATACGVLCFFCQSSRYEPWRDVAARVQSGSAAEVVFFESGLVVNDAGEPETSSAGLDSAFPEGYFKAAFDYYFKGANPRQAIDPARADGSRRLIANAAATVGGAWLISGKGEQRARTEMPTAPQFRVQRVFQHDLVSLYHVVPVVTVGKR